MEYDPRFSVARFRNSRGKPRQPSLSKRYNVVLRTRITLCTIAVDTKSFPAPVSNVVCSETSR